MNSNLSWTVVSPWGRAREGANLLVDNILHVDTIGGFWELKVVSCFKTISSSANKGRGLVY